MNLQVLVVALLTALVQYPNPYTRFNSSQVIRKLFSQCGPEDTGDLWCVNSLVLHLQCSEYMTLYLCMHIYTYTFFSFHVDMIISVPHSYALYFDHHYYSDYNLTSQSIDAEYHDTQALAGVWRASWQLVLAMVVKGLLVIFTFGIKVVLKAEFIYMYMYSCGCSIRQTLVLSMYSVCVCVYTMYSAAE